jgi:hypothetical protein
MSSHCSKYPGCGCGPDVGTKCHMENYDQEVQDQINLKYKAIEFETFKAVHQKHGVLVIAKETGPKGGFIIPSMPIPEWITADRIRFTSDMDKIKDLNDAIGYRPMTKKERKFYGYKRKPYGK